MGEIMSVLSYGIGTVLGFVLIGGLIFDAVGRKYSAAVAEVAECQPLMIPLGGESDFTLTLSAPVQQIKVLRGPTREAL